MPEVVIDESMLHPHPWRTEASRRAWESVKASGWAAKSMKAVYDVLYEKGPLTLREIDRDGSRALGKTPKSSKTQDASRKSTSVRAYYELKRHGLATKLDRKRVCTISEEVEPLYDVTEGLCPTERPEKKLTRKQLVARVEELEGALASLPPACPGCAAAGRHRLLPPKALDPAKTPRCEACGTKFVWK